MKQGQVVKAVTIGMVWMAALPSIAWGQCPWNESVSGKIFQTCGDVGIGTDSPYHYDTFKSLTIGGNYGGEIRVGQSTGWCQGQFYSTCYGAVLGTVYEHPLVLRTNGTEKMRIAANGNVGIGEANPVHKLAVRGTIKAQDVIITNQGWSDYVFRPGYRLRALSEVNAYIRTHRHLPDIPTAAEVKKKGVSVAEMQAKLLAKVEELTLHLIEQEKANRALLERLARLEARVAGK